MGTVITGIKAGEGIHILRALNLRGKGGQVTLNQNGADTLTLHDVDLTPEEGEKIALFAPNAQVQIVNGDEVVKRFAVTLPERVEAGIQCPNSNCITNHDAAPKRFAVFSHRNEFYLRCHYCEETFRRDHLIKEDS